MAAILVPPVAAGTADRACGIVAGDGPAPVEADLPPLLGVFLPEDWVAAGIVVGSWRSLL